MQLTDREAAEFFRSSYTAVDGLWFMMAEQSWGFDEALDLDSQVWQVMPKIQARMLQEMTGQMRGLGALAACLGQKMVWEQYEYECALSDDEAVLTITVRDCPWRRLLVKSGRESLSHRIGPLICGQEYAVWAKEFGPGIDYALAKNVCQGAATCTLLFTTSSETT